MNQVAILEEKPKINHYDHHFVRELIQQFRRKDSEQNYSHWSDQQLISSWVTSSANSLESLATLQISAFYAAVAAQIEKETGKLAQIVFNLGNNGLNSVLISCGNLLVILEVFQKTYHLGFNSIESLITTAEMLIAQAVQRIRQFF